MNTKSNTTHKRKKQLANEQNDDNNDNNNNDKEEEEEEEEEEEPQRSIEKEVKVVEVSEEEDSTIEEVNNIEDVEEEEEVVAISYHTQSCNMVLLTYIPQGRIKAGPELVMGRWCSLCRHIASNHFEEYKCLCKALKVKGKGKEKVPRLLKLEFGKVVKFTREGILEAVAKFITYDNQVMMIADKA
ncbi:hypothetical protein BJV74DRAFT_799922 [Russula compacta]|nr:hypothetical protein BJV74DRAFT_799922 [Russula compacta]